MLADSIESAARETNLWSHIRRTEECLAEVNGWDVFFRTSRFNGKELPVAARPETFDHIKMMLAAELVRLRRQAAP